MTDLLYCMIAVGVATLLALWVRNIVRQEKRLNEPFIRDWEQDDDLRAWVKGNPSFDVWKRRNLRRKLKPARIATNPNRYTIRTHD